MAILYPTRLHKARVTLVLAAVLSVVAPFSLVAEEAISTTKYVLPAGNSIDSVALQIPSQYLDTKSIFQARNASKYPTIKIDYVADADSAFFSAWNSNKNGALQKRHLEIKSLATKPFDSIADVASLVFNYSDVGKYKGVSEDNPRSHLFETRYGAWDVTMLPISAEETGDKLIRCTRTAKQLLTQRRYTCDEEYTFTLRDNKAVLDKVEWPLRSKNNQVIFVPKIDEMVAIRCARFSAIGRKYEEKVPCVLSANYRALFSYELTFPRSQLQEWQQIKKDAERLMASFVTSAEDRGRTSN